MPIIRYFPACQQIRIEFVDYMRPERRMEDIEALRYQLQRDREVARGLLI